MLSPPFSSPSILSFVVSISLLTLCTVVSTSTVFNVRNYGASGDGKTLDTIAIRKTFAAAEAVSEAKTVLFPSPGRYLTAPFNLTSNTTVEIASGAVILGVQDKSLYPIIAPLPSFGHSRDIGHSRYQPLVFGAHLMNVKLLGGGSIDGQGKYWWDLRESGSLKHGRPRLVELMWSSNLEICDVTLQNSGFWTLHPVYSENIYIHDVRIDNPPHSPNTDGIDPDSSANVLIERCNISVDDDHIAIKSGLNLAGREYNWPSKNITIRYCDFYRGDGITIGSETSGGIFDVYVHDCTMHVVTDPYPPLRGIYIKTALTRGNVIENVRYERVSVGLVQLAPITIRMTANSASPKGSLFPQIRNITYASIKGVGKTNAGQFDCSIFAPCREIFMQDVRLTAPEPWVCNHAYGTQQNVVPASCLKK